MFLLLVALFLILLSTLLMRTNVEQYSLFGIYMIQVCFSYSFSMSRLKCRQMADLQAKILLLFTAGCQRVSTRFPEQHGVRLEKAQLHRGCSWREHTLGGL